MDAELAKVTNPSRAGDVRMERAYRHWHAKDFKALLAALSDYPVANPRATEARYFEGLAKFHLVDAAGARKIWRALIKGCPQDPWVYRADWAYTSSIEGDRKEFGILGKRVSILKRIGYVGVNPDLRGPAPKRADPPP